MSPQIPAQVAERAEALVDRADGVVNLPQPLPVDDFDAQCVRVADGLRKLLADTLDGGKR